MPYCEHRYIGVAEFTYDRAMASEAHTGPSRVFPIGYKTPAAIGSAATLYANAHNWERWPQLAVLPYIHSLWTYEIKFDAPKYGCR